MEVRMRKFLVETWRDGVKGKLSVLLFALFVTVVAGLLGLAVYHIGDTALITTQEGTGAVVRRSCEPGRWSGKYYYPAKFALIVRRESEQDCVFVSQRYYDQVQTGDIIHIEYGHGRFSGSFYVKSVFW